MAIEGLGKVKILQNFIENHRGRISHANSIVSLYSRIYLNLFRKVDSLLWTRYSFLAEAFT